MTGTDIQNRARDILLDSSGVRWVEAQMIRWINDGQKAIHKIRPEAIYTATSVVVKDAPDDITAIADTLDVRDSFIDVLVDYVAYRCFCVDSEDVSGMQRSGFHKNRYLEGLAA